MRETSEHDWEQMQLEFDADWEALEMGRNMEDEE